MNNPRDAGGYVYGRRRYRRAIDGKKTVSRTVSQSRRVRDGASAAQEPQPGNDGATHHQRPDPPYRHLFLRRLRRSDDSADRKEREIQVLYVLHKGSAGRNRLQGPHRSDEKLDTVVAEHIEQRLLQPKRLEQILSAVLNRRKERAERRTAHIAELRKRAAEADAKLKRLYDAIENGIADVSDPMLKDRVTELKAIRDQARADAQRAAGALDRAGPTITPQALKIFASQARRRMRTENGGYRRDHLRALAQRVEVDAKEVRIMGSKSVLLRALVAASSAKTAGFGLPSFVPKWRGGQAARSRDMNSRHRDPRQSPARRSNIAIDQHIWPFAQRAVKLSGGTLRT